MSVKCNNYYCLVSLSSRPLVLSSAQNHMLGFYCVVDED